jgi:hypothetical protein
LTSTAARRYQRLRIGNDKHASRQLAILQHPSAPSIFE